MNPMKLRSELLLVLKSVFKEDGVPEKMICDGATEQVSGEAARLCKLAYCTIQQLERVTPWSNREEGNVGIVKSEIMLDLKESNCPMVLWCYAAERRGRILASTSKNIYSLGGQVPATLLQDNIRTSQRLQKLAGTSGYTTRTLKVSFHNQWNA